MTNFGMILAFVCFIICFHSSLAWNHLSYDSDNFMCSSFPKFCNTILDELGCDVDETARNVIPCGPDNKVEEYTGTCECLSPIPFNTAGGRVTTQLMNNRLQTDITWALEPWQEGPPYSLAMTFEGLCDKLMTKVNCPKDSVTIVTNTPSTDNYVCSCGTLNASGHLRNMVMDRLNDYNTKSTPVFADPVYLSVSLSIALILVVGKLGALVAEYVYLPPIVGYLLAGLGIQQVINPVVLNGVGFPHPSPSAELQSVTLIILFIRAGMSIKWKELKANMLGTILFAFVPYLGELLFWTYLSKDQLDGWNEMERGMFAAIISPVGASVILAAFLPKAVSEKQTYGYPLKQLITTGAIETAVGSAITIIFVNMNREGKSSVYPWIRVLPKWLNAVLVPVNLTFSLVFGGAIGLGFVAYMNWRLTESDNSVKAFVTKNKHMAATAPEMVVALVILGYLILALCTQQYIQQCTPTLALLACGFVINHFGNKQMTPQIFQWLSGAWGLAEIFLFTLTGCNLRMDNSNGPLPSQRGISAENVEKVFGLFFLGACGRFVGVILATGVMLYFWPKHRRSWKWFIPFWFVQLFFTFPKAAIQANFGSMPYNQRVLPSPEGMKKALLIWQGSALSILVFSALGLILAKFIAMPLAKYLTALDRENGWEPSTYKYIEDTTTAKPAAESTAVTSEEDVKAE